MPASDRPPRGHHVRSAEDEAVLGAFAHDVRSIAAAAEGLAFRARSRTEDPRVQSYLDAMREAMTRLSAMASTALDLARSGGEAPRTTDETVDVAAIARTVATTMEEAFREAGASCVLVTEAAKVRADRTAIYRIVLNLLTNALVHGSEAGGGRVRLAVTPVGPQVHVRVADEGPGFPRAMLGGAYPVPRWNAGRGLGLTIVARVVEQYGGELHIENGAPRGAVVTVKLPGVP